MTDTLAYMAAILAGPLLVYGAIALFLRGIK